MVGIRKVFGIYRLSINALCRGSFNVLEIDSVRLALRRSCGSNVGIPVALCVVLISLHE